MISTLGLKNKQTLKKEFGFKTITQAKKTLGFQNDVETYAFMQDTYNQTIIEIRKNKIANNKIFNQGFTIQVALDKITAYIKQNNIKNHFEVTLQSMTTDYKKTFKFMNPIHFENWERHILHENTDSNNTRINQVLKTFNVFNNAIIKSIKNISGGASFSFDTEKKITIHNYILNCFRPKTNRKDCIFTAVSYLFPDLIVDIKFIRKMFKIEGRDVEVIPSIALEILKFLNVDINLFDDSEKTIVLNENQLYIVLHDKHYYPVVSFKKKEVSKKKRRILMAMDFEVRPTEKFHTIQATGEKMYVLKDTIASVYYQNGYQKNADMQKIILKTDTNKSSARKFIDLLIQADIDHKHFTIIAHNGSNFDYYFILAVFTQEEYSECNINLRQTSVIGIEFRGHVFRDSYCFLTNSLDKLSKNFQVTVAKKTKFLLHGNEITNEELCFYKNKLTFNQFMNLQDSDMEFWSLYEEYCMIDSISLYEIWKKFTMLINGMIERISPYTLQLCPLNGSMTIGGHSKKILNCINNFNGKSGFDKAKMENFLHTNNIFDDNKYNFICQFKRGGISHCNLMGNHKSGVVGYDIKSQYPACLKFANMPCGKSFNVNSFDDKYHGFYHFESVYFDNAEHTFRIIAEANEGQSLNWKVDNHIVLNQYMDSYMVKYLIKNNGLNLTKSILTTGLVSYTEMPMNKLFGKYVDTFYSEKENQDKLDEEKSPLYNKALRESIKLYLNSLTGKLVENPEKYFKLIDDKGSEGKMTINGITKYKQLSDTKNEWVIAGVSVYRYSKILLCEYMNCLPNKTNDVIHVETDGVYFNRRYRDEFINNVNNYTGDFKEVAIGSKIGNIDFDCESPAGSNNYFLGKKFYLMDYNKNNEIQPKVKGFPKSTLLDDGKRKALVDIQLYEDHFNGIEIKKTFKTMKRVLTGDAPQILAYDMTRTLNVNKTKNFAIYL